ncbi:DUF72 domain-containing protein [Candidatus Curtissbacteria bacterium]|nr:DUF72 domain-containing protein [Candidatus Curtissbacteria bacterium]MBI2594532.1 DUF72 domain-containing protein [Candidatus Curtissbacteria bacterium]
MGKVYVGTSGWVYSDWRGNFYPKDLPQRRWLEFYSQHFKTVEVNSTFYHQMKPATFENWAKSVPDGFIFAVKASRFITHIKRLNVPKESIKTFFESISHLGRKLGPILFQCPPRWGADEKRLEPFLDLSVSLARPRLARLAFEFRDSSWFDHSVYEVLKKYNAALVIAESGGHPTSPRELRGARWPSGEVITADFTYIRFHGEGGSYATKYSNGELKIWAGKIKKWQKQGLDVYAYFNNDVAGFAVENARELISMI